MKILKDIFGCQNSEKLTCPYCGFEQDYKLDESIDRRHYCSDCKKRYFFSIKNSKFFSQKEEDKLEKDLFAAKKEYGKVLNSRCDNKIIMLEFWDKAIERIKQNIENCN